MMIGSVVTAVGGHDEGAVVGIVADVAGRETHKEKSSHEVHNAGRKVAGNDHLGRLERPVKIRSNLV